MPVSSAHAGAPNAEPRNAERNCLRRDEVEGGGYSSSSCHLRDDCWHHPLLHHPDLVLQVLAQVRQHPGALALQVVVLGRRAAQDGPQGPLAQHLPLDAILQAQVAEGRHSEAAQLHAVVARQP